MDPIFITVPGEAIGKGRPRARIVKPKIGPQFIQMYTPSETQKYEDFVKRCAQLVMRKHIKILGPVDVAVVIRVVPPQSWPNWKREAALQDRIRPDSKPDTDNIKKAVLDALNDVVFDDDVRATDIQARKRYAAKPAVLIRVTPLEKCSSRITRKDQLPPLPEPEATGLFPEQTP